MAITRATVEGWYVNGMLTNKAQIDMLWDKIKPTTRTYMVTVESEGFSADWLDDVIVIATDKDDARRGAEETVREYRGNHNVTIKEGTEVYELATEHPRVVGVLVPRDER